MKKSEILNHIDEITKDRSPKSQQDYIDYLSEIGIEKITQGEISKYLREKDIKKDAESGYYVLNDAMLQKNADQKLKTELQNADWVFFDETYTQLVLKCNPIHAQLMCASLEEYFSEYNVGTIAGLTGTVILYVPEKKEKEIKDKLTYFRRKLTKLAD